MRLAAYNMGQGGSRDPAIWERVLPVLAPDILLVQESREPMQSWLPALEALAGAEAPLSSRLLWQPVPGRKWGSGIWVREGHLTPLPVPELYSGKVVAAVVDGHLWPGLGRTSAVVFSIHAPTRKGSSYIKEVDIILSIAGELAGGLPLILGGDFNVVVGMRSEGQPIGISPGERALLTRIRDELALVPCWQTVHPGEPLARTLRWLRRLDSLPYHCDGLFVPASWAPALLSCSVLEEGDWIALSDHNPVVAELDPTG